MKFVFLVLFVCLISVTGLAQTCVFNINGQSLERIILKNGESILLEDNSKLLVIACGTYAGQMEPSSVMQFVPGVCAVVAHEQKLRIIECKNE